MTTKVFVGNLAFQMTDQALAEAFVGCGQVKSGVIITRGLRSLGYGFVDFTSPDDASAAVEKMNKTDLFGRSIKVELVKDPSERPPPRPRQPRVPASPPSAVQGGPQGGQLQGGHQGGHQGGQQGGPQGGHQGGHQGGQRGYGRPQGGPQGEYQGGYQGGQGGQSPNQGGYNEGAPGVGGDDREGGAAPRRKRYNKKPGGRRPPIGGGRQQQGRRRNESEGGGQPQGGPPPQDGGVPNPNYAPGPDDRQGQGRSPGYRPVRRRRTTNDQPKIISKTAIFVANLPFSVDDEILSKLFEEFHVKSAHVVKTRTGRSRGYGFVEFESENDQGAAIASKNSKEVVGTNGPRLISVTASHSVPPQKEETEGLGGSGSGGVQPLQGQGVVDQ